MTIEELRKIFEEAMGDVSTDSLVEALWSRGVRVVADDAAILTAPQLASLIHVEFCQRFRPMHSHPLHSADALIAVGKRVYNG